MSRFFAASIAVILACSCTLTVLAATTGLLRGTVTVDGKPVANATLTLEGEGSKFSAKSDATGAYVFSTVPYGTYRLIANSPGAHEFQTIVTIVSDTARTADVEMTTHLQVIARTTSSATAVTPSGNPVAVNIISKAQLQASPVQNSLDKTIETLPGIVQFSYNEPVANGFHGVMYQIDGAPLPLATSSNFAEIIDPKDIDSVEVYTGAIPAEYGGDRMGAVVNIISNRPSDTPPGFYGLISGGFGNQQQATGSVDMSARFGSSEAFLNFNTNTTNRGLDAPTFDPINDASSSSDAFLRFITQLNPRATLAFDYSNQLSQFQIPINTDPNNADDPIVSVPGTLDTQLEYDRFSNLNYTQTSKDGNGIFQVIPWWRTTRIDYDGDLAADVLGTQPNFGCPTYPTCAAPYPSTINSVGLQQNTNASYVGLNLSDFRATKYHTWKIGIQSDREVATADQVFACYYIDCNVPGPQGNGTTPIHQSPYYSKAAPLQSQAGSNIGIFGEDKWQVSQNVSFSYGLRYDHSTGYVGGWQLSPRLGLNVSDGGKNVFHAFYGRFYAAPQLEDVRATCVIFSAQAACPTTNPVYDLKPESDAYYELGVAHEFNPLLTGYVNFFQKNVSNVLDTTQFLNTPLFAVYNNAIGIDHGLEVRLQDKTLYGDTWFFSGTYSGSYAGGISGSTFLFPPNPNNGLSPTDPAGLGVEDHDETVTSTVGYTHRFGGPHKLWFATLQGNYGSGFPVQFQDADVNLNGRLPAHTTFDFAAGRNLEPGKGPDAQGIGLQLLVNNVLNHQYVIKVANGFNTTQIANGRNVLFKLTAPF